MPFTLNKVKARAKEVGIILFVLVAIVLVVGVVFKIFAPNSAASSRFGGAPVELEAPADCARIINMTKSIDHKYIIYVDTSGNVRMKEYSDWGILDGEYVVTGYKDPDVKLIKQDPKKD